MFQQTLMFYSKISTCFSLPVHSQVSDIFQFYTQRSSHEPRLEEMEQVASSTSRNSASSLRSITRNGLFVTILVYICAQFKLFNTIG